MVKGDCLIDEKVDHSSLGKTSLFISIICLIIVMIMIVLTVFGNIYGFFLFWPALILSLLSLLLGGIAYFGSFQDIYGLIAFGLGVGYLCIIPVIVTVIFQSIFFD